MYCSVYSEKTPDDGHRNCPKHVEFYSENKFEKLGHLVGFIIRIYHDARSTERQKVVLDIQLHSCHAQEGGPRSPQRTFGGIGKNIYTSIFDAGPIM